jgi:hypothetical protein
MSSDVFTSFTKGFGSFLGKVQKGVEQRQNEIREGKEAKEAGKIWDKQKQQWVFYILDQEWEELLEKEKTLGKKTGSTLSDGGDSGGNDEAEKPVKDRTVCTAVSIFVFVFF